VRRVAVVVVALLAGAAAGAATTAAVQDDASRAATTTTNPRRPAPTGGAGAPQVDAASTDGVLLAWAQSPGIPDDAAAAAAAVPGVTAVAVVRDGTVDLVGSADASGVPVDRLDDGWRIPLEVAAVDPAAYAGVAPPADRATIAGLLPGQALLGETSARLRRLGPGGRLDLADGTSLTVAAVVPDTTVGGAEVVVDTATGAAVGVDTPRAMLVAHGGDRAAVEAAVAATLGGRPVRFRAPGETPYLRAADAVLPQSIVKDRYGEFAYRTAGGDDRVEVDPAWIAANIVDADVPVLGAVRCHRGVVEPLREAMLAVESAGLGAAVQAAGFDGCFVPRTTRTGGSISRHSWGIAFDVGYGDNPTGAASVQRDQLVDILRRAGFNWGGSWLVPDAAHFERVV
jgi:hypothetical protein